MRNDAGYQAFLNFCKERSIAESCLFWKDAEKFRTAKGDTDLQKSAIEIYNKYFKEGSPLELNISKEMKDFVKQRLNNPSRNMFTSVQHDILYLLKSQKLFETYVYVYTQNH